MEYINYFDEIIDRSNTDSIKYDFAEKFGKPKDILPLWVADMDFRAPPCVIDALKEKSDHGIFGYSETGNDYTKILQDWFIRYFDWTIQPDWLVTTPGVVFAINASIRALTKKGDSVLIQQPVYYPFHGSVKANGRNPVINQLVYSRGKYSIDLEDFEDKIVRNNVKLFVLCSPHNPVGRVWSKGELTQMGDICLKHDVLVVSDEIHADFIYPGNRHIVFADIKPEYKEISVTCTAPTKTFNLAGLQISNMFIPDTKIRNSIKLEIKRTGYGQVNIMGIVATKAAYSNGHRWLSDLNEYLYGNLGLIRSYINNNLPRLKLVEPEGTYLAWIDFKDLGLDDREMDDIIVNRANLWLDPGTIFGKGGEGFQRINFACPAKVLAKALEQLERALNLLHNS